MKPCFKCGRFLPLSEFYPHRRMADGHLNKCKTCFNSDAVLYRAEVKASPERCAHQAALMKAYRQRRRQKLNQQRAIRYHLDETMREKIRVRTQTKRAVQRGIISRRPCEVCGCARSEAHHPDYSLPLRVKWLCRKHHAELHARETVRT